MRTRAPSGTEARPLAPRWRRWATLALVAGVGVIPACSAVASRTSAGKAGKAGSSAHHGAASPTTGQAGAGEQDTTTTTAPLSPSTSDAQTFPTTATPPAVTTSVISQSSTSPAYQVSVRYPQLSGMTDSATQSAINANLQAEAQKQVTSFVENARDLGGQPGASGTSTLSLATTTTRLDRTVVSFRLSGDSVISGAAHPSVLTVTSSFRLSDGHQLSLGELFMPDAPWLALISRMSEAQLDQRFGNQDWTAAAGPSPANFVAWSLAADGLEVTLLNAPDALGAPTVSFSRASLASVALPGGPLSAP
jgi:hypothetical protein